MYCIVFISVKSFSALCTGFQYNYTVESRGNLALTTEWQPDAWQLIPQDLTTSSIDVIHTHLVLAMDNYSEIIQIGTSVVCVNKHFQFFQ